MKRHNSSCDGDAISEPSPSPSKRKKKEVPNFEWNAAELKEIRFPTFQQPTEIGCFSTDADGKMYEDDPRYLAQYIGSNASSRSAGNRDLNEGRQFWNRKPVQTRENDELLTWLHRKMNSDPNFTVPQFVCFRGLLTRLLCFPYEQRERLRIAAIRVGRTIFFCRYETEERLERLQHETNDQRRFSYWGYRFEKYMTHYPGKNEARSVRNEQYASVVRSRLEEFSLLYAGEVDCVVEWKGKREYVELKTHRSLYQAEEDYRVRLRTYARRNLLHWWCQSFLLNISKVVVGFRNDEGIVELISEQNTNELYQNAKKILVSDLRNDSWRPNVCFNFLLRFLRHVQEVMPVDSTPSDEVFVFTFGTNQPATCEVFENSSNFYFLPDFVLNSRLATR